MGSPTDFINHWLIIPKVLYFTMNLAFYSCYTFRPKYLKSAYGISTSNYGLIASLLSLISFFGAYGWAVAVDRWRQPKRVLILTTAVSAASFQLFLVKGDWMDSSTSTMWATIVSAVYVSFVSALVPILDATMVKWLMDQPNASREMYGRQRLWGTIAYACISTFVGFFPLIPTVNISIGVLSLLFIITVHFLLPDDTKANENNSVVEEKKEEQDTQSPLWQLLTNFNFMFLLLVVFMNGLARAVMTHFLEPVQREVYRTPQSATGWSTVTGVFFEVVVFFFSSRLLGYFGERRMLLLAQLAMIGRVSCYAFIPRSFSGAKYAPIAFELFKGLNFGFMHSAGVQMATKIAPAELKATAQSLFSGVYSGLAASVAGVFGYLIFRSMGEKNVVETSDKMLKLTSYLSIFALVIFLLKYIVYDEWMKSEEKEIDPHELEQVVKSSELKFEK